MVARGGPDDPAACGGRDASRSWGRARPRRAAFLAERRGGRDDRAMSSDLPARAPGPAVRLVARPIAPCAEMPNDNPALHAGAIWGNDCGAPSLHRRTRGRRRGAAVRRPVRSRRRAASSGLDELVPPPRHSRSCGSRRRESRQACSGVAPRLPSPAAARPSSAGRPRYPLRPRGPANHAGGRFRDLARPWRPTAADARLLALLDTGPDGAAPAARLARGYRGWARTLAGEDVDFAETGGTMLDEWAALACSAALGEGVAVTALRRELRARGGAAFGLVDAA